MKRAQAPAVAQVVVASVTKLNLSMKEVGDFPRYFVPILVDLSSSGGNLNAVSRQALMQKLARTEQPALKPPEMYVLKLYRLICLTARSQQKAGYHSDYANSLPADDEHV